MNNIAERKQTVLIAGDERSLSLASNYWLINFWADSENSHVCVEPALWQYHFDRIYIWLIREKLHLARSPVSWFLDSKSLNSVTEVWVKASLLLSISYSKIPDFLPSVYTDHHPSEDTFFKDLCFLLNEIIK